MLKRMQYRCTSSLLCLQRSKEQKEQPVLEASKKYFLVITCHNGSWSLDINSTTIDISLWGRKKFYRFRRGDRDSMPSANINCGLELRWQSTGSRSAFPPSVYVHLKTSSPSQAFKIRRSTAAVCVQRYINPLIEWKKHQGPIACRRNKEKT